MRWRWPASPSRPTPRAPDWADVEPALRAAIAAQMDRPGGPLGRPLYVVAEKILGADEALVDSWPVHGTSGYDFLNQVNGLFVDPDAAREFTRRYQDHVEDDARFSEVVYRKKRLIMQVSLSSELHMLTNQLDRLAQQSRRSRDFTFNTLRQALRRRDRLPSRSTARTSPTTGCTTPTAAPSRSPSAGRPPATRS